MALVSVNPIDISDPEHPQITWSVAEGSRGDYGAATLKWGGGTATNFYSIYFPPDLPTSFRVPDVPLEFSSYAPKKTSSFELVGISYTDDERVTGYESTFLFNDVPAMDGLGSVASSGREIRRRCPRGSQVAYEQPAKELLGSIAEEFRTLRGGRQT